MNGPFKTFTSLPGAGCVVVGDTIAYRNCYGQEFSGVVVGLHIPTGLVGIKRKEWFGEEWVDLSNREAYPFIRVYQKS